MSATLAWNLATVKNMTNKKCCFMIKSLFTDFEFCYLSVSLCVFFDLIIFTYSNFAKFYICAVMKVYFGPINTSVYTTHHAQALKTKLDQMKRLKTCSTSALTGPGSRLCPCLCHTPLLAPPALTEASAPPVNTHKSRQSTRMRCLTLWSLQIDVCGNTPRTSHSTLGLDSPGSRCF